MNSLVARTLCLAAFALALAAALPTTETVVPEQELVTTPGYTPTMDYGDIYDDEDNSTLENDEEEDDRKYGMSSESNDLGGAEASKDADEIAKQISDQEKKDAADNAKWEAEAAVKPSKLETLKSMVSAFGKKEKDPVNGKTYWEEEEELLEKEEEIKKKKEAAAAKLQAKRDAETKAAEAKYDDVLSNAFAKAKADHEAHEEDGMKEAAKAGAKAEEKEEDPDPEEPKSAEKEPALIPKSGTSKSIDCDHYTGNVLKNC